MRSKSLNTLFDNLLWYLVYMLPLILLLVLNIKTGGISLAETFSTCGLSVIPNSQVYETLTGIFGQDGILPLFASADIVCYGIYFVSTYLLHLLVDVLLWIPRLAHHWMSKCGGDN